MRRSKIALFAIFIAIGSVESSAAQTLSTAVADIATGIRIKIPGISRGPAASKFGSLWTDANDGLQVDTLNLSNRVLDDLSNTICKVSGRRITKVAFDHGFGVEGIDRDQRAF